MTVESLTLTSIGPIINHTIPFYEIKICPKINVQWPTCCLERQKRTTQRPSWPAPFSASTRKKSMRVKSLVCTTRWAMRWNQETWKWLDRICGGFLGGGFKYFLFLPLLGEMIQFDSYFSTGLKPPTRESAEVFLMFFLKLRMWQDTTDDVCTSSS